MTYNPFSPQSQPTQNPFGQQAPQGGYQAQPGAQPFGQAPAFGAPPQFGAPQGGFGHAPAQPPQFNLAGMGSAEAGGDRFPPLPQGGHGKVRIDTIRIKRGDPSQGTSHQTFFIAELTVLESSNAQPGTRGTMMETISGAQYNQADALARVRMLVNAAYGMEDKDPAVMARWNDPNQAQQILLDAMNGALNGKEVAFANVSHKITKGKGKLIATYTPARVGAQVAAAPVIAQAPVVTQMPVYGVPSFPPAGWQPSAQYPGCYIGKHPQTGELCTVTENDLKAAVASNMIR